MRENPVRTGAAWVAAKSHFVFIVPEGLDGLAEELLSLPDPEWVGRYHYRGEEELTLRYLLALDALNFCFWPPYFPGKTSPSPLGEEGWGKGKWGVPGPDGERLTGYYALSFALCRIAQDFPEFFEAENLQKIEPEKLREFLGPYPASFLEDCGATGSGSSSSALRFSKKFLCPGKAFGPKACGNAHFLSPHVSGCRGLLRALGALLQTRADPCSRSLGHIRRPGAWRISGSFLAHGLRGLQAPPDPLG
jgi:hypothetical protein